jgi:hypothetical protein
MKRQRELGLGGGYRTAAAREWRAADKVHSSFELWNLPFNLGPSRDV